MSWIAVRVQLSITHQPLPQLVLADVPSDRKAPAKHSGWPRHHLLQVWCDGSDKNAIQSFWSNKVRKGWKEEKTLSFGFGFLGVVWALFLVPFEGKDFRPTYSHNKLGDHGLLEGFLCDGEDRARKGFLHHGEDEARSFPLHHLDQHSLHGMSLWTEIHLLRWSVAGPAGNTPLFYESKWFQEILVDHEPEILTLAPEAAQLLGVMSKLELPIWGETHPAAAQGTLSSSGL